MTAMLGGVLPSSMPKLHFWQPRALAFHLSLRLLPLPQSKVGLILFYLSLSLHLPWLLCLALVVFFCWPRCLFNLHQLFMVGPSFLPVPAKVVSQIVAGEFVELNELLNELEPQLWFDGWLVLTSTPKKLKQWVDDITSWLEASLERFAALSTAYPPHSLPVRWTGLLWPTPHWSLPCWGTKPSSSFLQAASWCFPSLF